MSKHVFDFCYPKKWWNDWSENSMSMSFNFRLLQRVKNRWFFVIRKPTGCRPKNARFFFPPPFAGLEQQHWCQFSMASWWTMTTTALKFNMGTSELTPHPGCQSPSGLPSLKLTARTQKWMVGILVSFSDGLFLRAMLVLRMVFHFC